MGLVSYALLLLTKTGKSELDAYFQRGKKYCPHTAVKFDKSTMIKF